MIIPKAKKRKKWQKCFWKNNECDIDYLKKEFSSPLFWLLWWWLFYAFSSMKKEGQTQIPVSYTHLDVYKRQMQPWISEAISSYSINRIFIFCFSYCFCWFLIFSFFFIFPTFREIFQWALPTLLFPWLFGLYRYSFFPKSYILGFVFYFFYLLLWKLFSWRVWEFLSLQVLWILLLTRILLKQRNKWALIYLFYWDTFAWYLSIFFWFFGLKTDLLIR